MKLVVEVTSIPSRSPSMKNRYIIDTSTFGQPNPPQGKKWLLGAQVLKDIRYGIGPAASFSYPWFSFLHWERTSFFSVWSAIKALIPSSYLGDLLNFWSSVTSWLTAKSFCLLLFDCKKKVKTGGGKKKKGGAQMKQKKKGGGFFWGKKKLELI